MDEPEEYSGNLTRIAWEEMRQPLFVLSPDGRVLQANRVALAAASLTREQALGRFLWELFRQTPTQSRDGVRAAVPRAAGGRTVSLELAGSATSGAGTIPVNLALYPVCDEAGQVVLLLAEGNGALAQQAHPVETALQHEPGEVAAPKAGGALQAVAEPSALLTAIVDSCDDAIVGKDLNGIILSWNQSAERLFGYTANEAIGRSITMLIPPERQDEEPKILEKLRAGERVEHFETIRVRKDGSLLNISLTISPVRDATGRVVGASKVARDITERISQEQALNETIAALKRANSDLQQFVYSASHDLQEPLRMVVAYSELLQRKFSGTLGALGDEYIANTVQGAMRMETLLRDLRTYTQVSTSSGQPDTSIDAGAVLERVLVSLGLAIRNSGATVTSDALPRVRLHEFQLEQVFQNLIGNAIRYRAGEPPRIHISAALEGRQWRFSVQDNGIGIEPEFQEQIFGIFKRLHSAADYPGAGMGLAICQRIVERAGGRIWVESEPGRGSVFYFTVPCEKPAFHASGSEIKVDTAGRG